MHCENKQFTIGQFLVEKNIIDTAPEYQRQAGAWGRDKKELFLDTLFRQYDVPKIYMHKLQVNGGRYVYALVDGKQRLQCIWDFLDDKIPFGTEDFESGNPVYRGHTFPKKGDRYSDLSKFWQMQFQAISLNVVLIHDAVTDDIEDLFLRLNNGEPLNAAEKRNAMGGDMCRLIKKVTKHRFFTETVMIPDDRYKHLDLAARFLLMEEGVKNGNGAPCILKKRFLDSLVKRNDQMSANETKELRGMVEKQLNSLCRVFGVKDPLLKRAGYPQLYYLFVKEMERLYAGDLLYAQIKEFLRQFATERAESLALDPDEKTDDDRHLFLDEFERLMQQGNDKISLEKRVATMVQFFLRKYPQTQLRDKYRSFSEAERYAIFYRSDGKCEVCDTVFGHYGEFEADHAKQWAHGGSTTLDNARALCKSCNAKANKKVA